MLVVQYLAGDQIIGGKTMNYAGKQVNSWRESKNSAGSDCFVGKVFNGEVGFPPFLVQCN